MYVVVSSAYFPQAYRSLSKCIAAICDSCPGETLSTVHKFIHDVKVREEREERREGGGKGGREGICGMVYK